MEGADGQRAAQGSGQPQRPALVVVGDADGVKAGERAGDGPLLGDGGVAGAQPPRRGARHGQGDRHGDQRDSPRTHGGHCSGVRHRVVSRGGRTVRGRPAHLSGRNSKREAAVVSRPAPAPAERMRQPVATPSARGRSRTHGSRRVRAMHYRGATRARPRVVATRARPATHDHARMELADKVASSPVERPASGARSPGASPRRARAWSSSPTSTPTARRRWQPRSAGSLWPGTSPSRRRSRNSSAKPRRRWAASTCSAQTGVAVGTDLTTPQDVRDFAFAVYVHAAKGLLPGWLERGEGYFLSTASSAGLLTQIGSAPYAVTKHATAAFAEWLSVTYRGVRMSCLCPMGVRRR